MNALARALETSQQHRFTLDDVLRMQEAGILDESARVELIDGALVEMAPEGTPHTRIKMQLAKRFMATAGPTVEVIVDSTLRLAPTYAPDPDLYLYDAALPLGDVTGTNVGLVIEVAHSTLRNDLAVKAEIYAQHGVRDYWVVDVNTDTLIVHRGLAGGVYRDVTHHTARETVSALVLPSVSLCLADLPPIR
ncbi:Uma2 family endonuclease [Caulobacter sp. BE264]|uniref:Uma2 family endonuclease n=1 Tax=Caulobacter sp. BE264 TaxID=2817724 RepID=UPI00285FAA1D|nr:Uma2 family endonuclease [Caulobacter sp. BE264]MDR7230150.1 Uma2 family endonuclease [Caulobacter sp. BE264]